MSSFVLEQEFPSQQLQQHNQLSSPPSSLSSSAAATAALVSRGYSIHSPETLTLESCRCPHLKEYLPHILNLEAVARQPQQLSNKRNDEVALDTTVPTTASSSIHNNNSSINQNNLSVVEYQLVNPVHALHLRSHVDNPIHDSFFIEVPSSNTTPTNSGTSSSSSSNNNNNNRQTLLPTQQQPLFLLGGGICLYGEEQLRTQALLTEGISESISQTLQAIRPPKLPTHFIFQPPPLEARIDTVKNGIDSGTASRTNEQHQKNSLTASSTTNTSAITSSMITPANSSALVSSITPGVIPHSSADSVVPAAVPDPQLSQSIAVASTTPTPSMTTILTTPAAVASTSTTRIPSTLTTTSMDNAIDAPYLPEERYTALLKNENQLLLIRHKLAVASSATTRKKSHSSSSTNSTMGSRQLSFTSSSSSYHPVMMMNMALIRSVPSSSTTYNNYPNTTTSTSSSSTKRRKTGGPTSASITAADTGVVESAAVTSSGQNVSADYHVSSPDAPASTAAASSSATFVPSGDGSFQPIPTLSITTTSSKNVLSSSELLQKQEQQQQRQQQLHRTHVANRAKAIVTLWMDHFRLNRRLYWQEQKHKQQQQNKTSQRKRQPQQHVDPFQKSLSMDFFASNNNRQNQNPPTTTTTTSSRSSTSTTTPIRCCEACRSSSFSSFGSQSFAYSLNSWMDPSFQQHRQQTAHGDELMQCLECSFVGCGPSSIVSTSSLLHHDSHILQHMLATGHGFAVSCGSRAELYCFACGDVVYHPLFDQERERLDLEYGRSIPWMAWREHPVQRSFDSSCFVRTEEHGLVWRGLIATYPSLVPADHIRAARLSLHRQAIFQGRLDHPWLALSKSQRAIDLAAFLRLHGPLQEVMISAPVGMYNLGNTCFQSAILQCLVHCRPFQQYFLQDCGHDHRTCAIHRKATARGLATTTATTTTTKPSINNNQSMPGGNKARANDEVCLACEMDILFLQYMGRTIGINILAALSDADGTDSRSDNEMRKLNFEDINYNSGRGEPLITTEMLTVAWKSGGMDHLIGYEQRDAHEYLHAFLEILGKHVKQYRERVYASLNQAGPYALEKHEAVSQDIVKKIFEGTLRSVLICEECGNKRSMTEQFLSVSLPLAKEVERRDSVGSGGGAAAGGGGKRGSHVYHHKAALPPLSVQCCLDHFTAPERLSDPVDCPACQKKTLTKKQHTFSKLPKVLCLHLKRFDAAQNKKIDDFVSFPARGLNLGVYLPHWCEVSRFSSARSSHKDAAVQPAEMQIVYDLFGTVNHHGTLQSGHYVTNVKVKDKWYHCNDAHVSRAGDSHDDSDGGENAVLTSDGAYLLFYTRR